MSLLRSERGLHVPFDRDAYLHIAETTRLFRLGVIIVVIIVIIIILVIIIIIIIIIIIWTFLKRLASGSRRFTIYNNST